MDGLESQVAQNNRPLYPRVAHNSLQVAHNYRPLACIGGDYKAALGSHGPLRIPNAAETTTRLFSSRLEIGYILFGLHGNIWVGFEGSIEINFYGFYKDYI